jgi:hypothetical protein
MDLDKDYDTSVKLHVYGVIAETARVPAIREVADGLGSSPADVSESFRRLNKQRLLALDPETGEIIMAPPFSAVETTFKVAALGKSFYANCVWDSLGIAAALHSDADVVTSCGDCGAFMSLQVRNGQPVPEPCTIHFAVPAAHWWDDIVYT